MNVDRLITRFELDDRYSGGAAKVAQSNEKVAASMSKVAAAKVRAGGSTADGIAKVAAEMDSRGVTVLPRQRTITKIQSHGDLDRDMAAAKRQMAALGSGVFGLIGAGFAASVGTLIVGGAMLFRAAAKHDASIQASLSRTQSSIDKAVTVAGLAFSKKLLPLAEDFAAAVDSLVADGSVARAFDKIAANFAAVLGLDPDVDSAEVMKKAAEKMLEAAVMISDAARLGKILTAFSPFDFLTRLIGGIPGSEPAAAKGTPPVSRADRAKNALGSSMALGAEIGTTLGNRMLSTMEQVERHTKEMLDIQRMVLGGGELGRHGVTAVQVGQMRNGRRPSGGGRVEVAVNNLVDAIMASPYDAFDKLSRGRARA